jgi:hypothetical protein
VPTDRHLVVASHQRSGTHLTIDAVLNNLEPYDTYHDLDHLAPRHPHSVTPEAFAARLRRGPAVLKTHTHRDLEAYFETPEAADLARRLLEEHPVVYVHRDGRDVLTSLYYYARENDDLLRSVSFSEFLAHPTPLRVDDSARELTPAAYWKRHVEGWLDGDPAQLVSFEAMKNRYEQSLREIASLVDQPLSRPITNVVRTRDLEERTLIVRLRDKLYKWLHRNLGGVELTYTSFRSGRSRTFLECFDEDDLQRVESEIGPLLERLGYERTGPSTRSAASSDSAEQPSS